ncbi:TauD/TfdA family dioxygenase [Amycolatopsis sp. NPDC054798]
MDNDAREWRPLEITPAGDGAPADVSQLLTQLDSLPVDDLLAEHRAILLRGFAVPEEALEQVTGRLLAQRLAYLHGNSPRTKIGDNIYTSTEFPPEYDISMHNELSYAHAWPSRLVFSCALPAATGGATPLVHGGLWLNEIDETIRDAFSGGVRYRQHLHGGIGLGKSWQSTFETDDREAVEEFLASGNATWEWTPAGGLRISQTRPATKRHPVTGEEVWFNQVDQWHIATLGDDTVRDLLSALPEEDLPQSIAFADGRPIPAEYALRVREIGWELAVDVQWRLGDVLLIDNVAVAHGRRAYTGSRRILVAMSS